MYKGNVAIAVSIIEDDAQTRKILAGWISRASGFDLAGEWGDAEGAMESLTKVKPNVVLMDINLPGMSGVEAVRKLKLALPDTQFVMLTVYEDANHIYSALAAGASGYLLKQTPRKELLAALGDVHRGGSPMTSNIARKVVQSFPHQPAGFSAGDGELSPPEPAVLGKLSLGHRC